MDLFFLNFVSFLFLIAFTSIFFKKWKRSQESNTVKKLPPGPWKLPFIGHVHHLIGSIPHHALKKLAQIHGDLMHLQLGEISAIVVSSPRIAKEVLKTHDLAFADRSEFLAAKIISYDYSDIGFSPYGEHWRQMRKVCTLELLSTKNVRSFESVRRDVAFHLISSIRAQAERGTPINLTETISSYTSSVICRAAFGRLFGRHQSAFTQLVKEMLLRMGGFDVSDLFPSMKILHNLSTMKPVLVKLIKSIDKILDMIIDEHMENIARSKTGNAESGQEDLVDVLLRIKHSGELHVPVTRQKIKAIIVDMFIGGTETSSAVVEWAMSEMIRHPNILGKAQSEIRKALKGKKTIEEADIQELSYLKLVIKETLRLHPPIPLLLPRQSREPCEIDGYTIPVKTRVMINVWAIGRDPKYWDDPESFKPERFENNNSVDLNGTSYEYLPFGGGRRICPGISFGLANVEVPLAHFLYYFNWKLPGDMRPEGLDMTETNGITAARKDNLLLIASASES